MKTLCAIMLAALHAQPSQAEVTQETLALLRIEANFLLGCMPKSNSSHGEDTRINRCRRIVSGMQRLVRSLRSAIEDEANTQESLWQIYSEFYEKARGRFPRGAVPQSVAAEHSAMRTLFNKLTRTSLVLKSMNGGRALDRAALESLLKEFRTTGGSFTGADAKKARNALQSGLTELAKNWSWRDLDTFNETFTVYDGFGSTSRDQVGAYSMAELKPPVTKFLNSLLQIKTEQFLDGDLLRRTSITLGLLNRRQYATDEEIRTILGGRFNVIRPLVETASSPNGGLDAIPKAHLAQVYLRGASWQLVIDKGFAAEAIVPLPLAAPTALTYRVQDDIEIVLLSSGNRPSLRTSIELVLSFGLYSPPNWTGVADTDSGTVYWISPQWTQQDLESRIAELTSTRVEEKRERLRELFLPSDDLLLTDPANAADAETELRKLLQLRNRKSEKLEERFPDEGLRTLLGNSPIRERFDNVLGLGGGSLGKLGVRTCVVVTRESAERDSR